MAANIRISKAIEAMSTLGFPKETVRTILQDLLKKCKRKWKLIEEDNYYMLVDALIKNEQENEEKGKELQKLSEDESEDEQPLARARLKCQTADSSALAPECNAQYMQSPPHDEHEIAYRATEQTSYNVQLKPIMEIKLLSSGTFDTEAGDNSLGYPSAKRRRLAPEESIHSSDSEDIDFISDVCPSPEVKSLDPRSPILHGQSGCNKILDKNCSYSCGTNLLEMMNVDDEFDALPSPPCEEGVVIEEKDTHMEDEMDFANVDQAFFNSTSDSDLEPCRIVNTLDLTHCKHDFNLKTISNGESHKVDDEPSNRFSTPIPLMIIRSKDQYYVEDITRGAEEKKISLINNVNSEEMPTFRYIPQSIPYCDAPVKFPLVHILESKCCSSCLGDCTSSGKPCLCAQKSAGGFAYGTGCVVKDEFIDKCISTKHKSPQQLSLCQVCPPKRLSGQCKGHVIRDFITECWYKCGCDYTCGNRTVQRGIRAKLQVFMTSEGKGWGLRTLEDLPRGAFICEYAGEILTTMEVVERKMKNMDSQQAYSILLDADWRSKDGFKDKGPLSLDGESYGNVARFINHRCHDANMIEIPVEVDTPNHSYYHVAFFTTRKVKAMEELTWDYGINFRDDSWTHKSFPCCCGSDFCRGKKMVKTETCSVRIEKVDVIKYQRKRAHKTIVID